MEIIEQFRVDERSEAGFLRPLSIAPVPPTFLFKANFVIIYFLIGCPKEEQYEGDQSKRTRDI